MESSSPLAKPNSRETKKSVMQVFYYRVKSIELLNLSMQSLSLIPVNQKTNNLKRRDRSMKIQAQSKHAATCKFSNVLHPIK